CLLCDIVFLVCRPPIFPHFPYTTLFRSRGYQTLLEDAVEGMPSGVRGFQVLSTVVHRDPPNQQALGTHLVIDRTVLTYLLDDLRSEEHTSELQSRETLVCRLLPQKKYEP